MSRNEPTLVGDGVLVEVVQLQNTQDCGAAYIRVMVLKTHLDGLDLVMKMDDHQRVNNE